MPKKTKRSKRLVNFRGKGGFGEVYEKARKWSRQGVGKAAMVGGRALLNTFFPGAGNLAATVMDYLGWGKYKGSKNTILEASPVPMMHAQPDKGVRIIHKEFLGEVESSSAFTLKQYAINPGVATSFPWLAGIASNFSKYKLNGLVFYFKSTAANVAYSTNNALGAIVGCVNYNVYDNPPTTSVGALNMSGVMEEKPTKNCVFPVECDRFHAVYPTYYVRSRTRSDDLSKYDCGRFNLITFGSQAVATVGQLWVAYDFTLIQPLPTQLDTLRTPIGDYNWELSGTVSKADVVPNATLSDNNVHIYTEDPVRSNATFRIPPQALSYQAVVEWDVNVTNTASMGIDTWTLVNLTLIKRYTLVDSNHVRVIAYLSSIDPDQYAYVTPKVTADPTDGLLVADYGANHLRITLRPSNAVTFRVGVAEDIDEKEDCLIKVEEPTTALAKPAVTSSAPALKCGVCGVNAKPFH